jgi:hypothetical protein
MPARLSFDREKLAEICRRTGIKITACSRFPHRVDIATGSVCGSSVLQGPRKLRNGHVCLMLPPGEP